MSGPYWPLARFAQQKRRDREFWHDDNFPYFLVTLKPFDNDSGQGDGSAFTNAFCRREGTR